MKAYIVYRPGSEYDTEVNGYLRELKYRTGKTLEEVNPDTKDGAAKCRVYDIVEYPSIMVTDNNGVLQNVWRGLPLPLINEISYYVE